MKNLPEAGELLRIARETLLAELRPQLDEQGRYTAAMIANAMAIAMREIAAGRSSLQESAEDDRRLAHDIRAGKLDEGEARRRLLDRLRESVNARLAISNPKYLK